MVVSLSSRPHLLGKGVSEMNLQERKDFLKLPMEERRKILKKQAQQFYEDDLKEAIKEKELERQEKE